MWNYSVDSEIQTNAAFVFARTFDILITLKSQINHLIKELL